MDNPKEAPTRRTLKLKVPCDKTRLATPRTSAPILPRAAPAVAHSRDPTAWADAHKKKMQAEMDALGFADDQSPREPPRR